MHHHFFGRQRAFELGEIKCADATQIVTAAVRQSLRLEPSARSKNPPAAVLLSVVPLAAESLGAPLDLLGPSSVPSSERGWRRNRVKRSKGDSHEESTGMAMVENWILLVQNGRGKSANQCQLFVLLWTRNRNDCGCSSVVKERSNIGPCARFFRKRDVIEKWAFA